MPAKKGTRPPAAGRGRKKGVPNKVTASTREMFAAFVDRNLNQVQSLYNRVARKNPAYAIELLLRFAEFSIPRLRHTENSGGGLAVNFNMPGSGPIRVTTQEEAASVYRELMGSPAFDYDRIVWEIPAPPADTMQAPTSPEPRSEDRAPPRPAGHLSSMAEDAPSTVVSFDEARAAREAKASPAPSPVAADPEERVISPEEAEDARLRYLRPERVLT